MEAHISNQVVEKQTKFKPLEPYGPETSSRKADASDKEKIVVEAGIKA